MKKPLDIAPLTIEKTRLSKNALQGEVAVVTGGTSNIGLATAWCLAWLGAKVVIAARNPETGAAVFTFIPTLVGRPRTTSQNEPRTFIAPPAMPGYPGPIPPEDCGAALAYSIVHAADIHGSGINIGQAFRQMKWQFPKPETVPQKDYDRIRDEVMVRMFGYIGPGFPDPRQPPVSINPSETLKKAN